MNPGTGDENSKCTVVSSILRRRTTSPPVRATLAASAALMALGAMVMGAVSGPLPGYAASVLFGTGVGGILTMTPVAWANYFGRAHFGAIRGMTLPAQVGGQAAGPLLAGLLHDLTGDYASGLATFAALSLLAAAVALVTPAPRLSGRASPADTRDRRGSAP